MPTARGRVIRDQRLAEREERRADRAAGGAPAPEASSDPNQNQPRFRTREELLSQIEADRAARRAAHKARNERAAAQERQALRETQEQRTQRLRSNRLAKSTRHKEINARAVTNEATEREQLARRRAGLETDGPSGVQVKDFRHGSQGQKARQKPEENKSLTPEENKDGENGEKKEAPLEGVRFASPSAAARADQLGLTSENFKRRRASGKTGFTTEDVDRIGKLAHEGEGGEDAEEGAEAGGSQ